MSLTIKVVQNGINEAGTLTGGEQKRISGNTKSVFAGNLESNFTTDSLVEQKRQSARKQAMKLISDAWGKDQKANQKIKDMQSLKKDLQSGVQDAQTRIGDIEEKKSLLQQEYQVDSDSQEQKDLELLQKFQDYQNGVDYPEFSKEEVERLRELQNVPWTEYQSEVLKLNDEAGKEKINIAKAEYRAKTIQSAIKDAKVDQLKSQDMLKASDAADEIMDAASGEIQNLLMQDGKDNIEEKMEEEQKKAEENQKKKEEQQERIDATKEKRKEQEEILRGELETDKLEMDVSFKQQVTNEIEIVQKNIQKIVKENHCVNEDLKGIKIDFKF